MFTGTVLSQAKGTKPLLQEINLKVSRTGKETGSGGVNGPHRDKQLPWEHRVMRETSQQRHGEHSTYPLPEPQPGVQSRPRQAGAQGSTSLQQAESKGCRLQALP